MKVILDGTTLTSDEIKKAVSQFNNFYISSNIDDIKVFEDNSAFEVIYLTKSNTNTRFICKEKSYYPVLVKITDNFVWNKDELQVDAKVKSIDAFLSKEFVTLAEESFSYNNLKINNTKDITYFKSTEIDFEFSFGTNDIDISYIDSYSLGRYFPKDHSKDNLNVYSSRILKAKYAENISKKFYTGLLDIFLSLKLETFDYVFFVPCRATKPDRFEGIHKDKGLYLLEDYEETKCKSREEKIEIMTGKFALKEGFNVKDKTILIVDDVYTTNATLTVITRYLNEYKPKKISWLTFGRNTHYDGSNRNYVCPKCSNSLCIRFNNTTGNWFLTCKNYKECKTNFSAIIFEATDKIYL